MKLTIISPQSKLYDGEALSVNLPGVLGSFTILENHAPIVSVLQKGTIKVQTLGNELSTFDIESGFVEVHQNRINLCVEQA